jgi:hypothetical protein
VRYARTSLTGSDFGDGWIHSARVAYKSAWQRWHQLIAAGDAAPYVAHPMAERPFPANAYIAGTPPEQPSLDVVVVGDARAGANTPGSLEHLVRGVQDLAHDGLTVGYAQIDSVSTTKQPGILPAELQDMVNAGSLIQLHADDRARAHVVLVPFASILQGIPALPRNTAAEHVVMVENTLSRRDSHGRTFVRDDVLAIAEAAFGATPRLVIAETEWPSFTALVREAVGTETPSYDASSRSGVEAPAPRVG